VKRIVIHFIPCRPAFAAIANERQLDKARASPASGRILNCFPARQFYRARSSLLFDETSGTTNEDEFQPGDASRSGSAWSAYQRAHERSCASRRDMCIKFLRTIQRKPMDDFQVAAYVHLVTRAFNISIDRSFADSFLSFDLAIEGEKLSWMLIPRMRELKDATSRDDLCAALSHALLYRIELFPRCLDLDIELKSKLKALGISNFNETAVYVWRYKFSPKDKSDPLRSI